MTKFNYKKLILFFGIAFILSNTLVQGANIGDTLDKINIGEYVSFGGSIWRKARYYQHDQYVSDEHGYFIRLFDPSFTSQYHPTSNNFANSTINTVALANFYSSLNNTFDMKYAIKNNSWFVTNELGGGLERIYAGKIALPSYHEVYNNTQIFGIAVSPYFWTRTPVSSNVASVYVFANSYNHTVSMVHHSIYAVVPSVRLTTYGTTILSGAGTSGSPYVLTHDPSAVPPIILNDPGLDLIATPTNDLKIYGEINYPAVGENLTVSATINGVTKSANFVSPAVSQDWHLSWGLNEVNEGIYTNINFVLSDGVNNFTATYVGRAIFDKTPPTCGTWNPSIGPWKKLGSTTFTLENSTDSGSGIHITGDTCTTGNNHGDTCAVQIQDLAGNNATCTSPINRIEATAPEINFINTSSLSAYYGVNSFPEQIFSVQDSLSGLASVRYAWTSNASNPFNANCSSGGNNVTVTSGDTNLLANQAIINKPQTSGIYYLHVCVGDVAGNINKTESVYYLDTTPPTSGSISYHDGYINDQNLLISVDPGMDADSGLSDNDADYVLEYRSAVLSAGSCGAYGSWANTGVTASASASSYQLVGEHGYCYQFRYQVKDRASNATTYTSGAVTKVVLQAPNHNNVCYFTPVSNLSHQYVSATTLYYNPAQAGSFSLTASVSADLVAGIEKVSFPTLQTGFSPNATDITTSPFALTYNWNTSATTAPGDKQLTLYSNSGLSSNCDFRIEKDATPPQLGSITYTDQYLNNLGTNPIVTVADGSDTQAGIDITSRQLQRASAPLADNQCGDFSAFTDISFAGTYPNLIDTAEIADHTCYMYRYRVSDRVSNQATYTSGAVIKVDTTKPNITLSNITYTSSHLFYKHGERTLYYQPDEHHKSFVVEVDANDPESGIAKVVFSGSSDSHLTPTTDQEATASPYLHNYILQTTANQSYPNLILTAYNHANLIQTTDFNLISDTAGPSGVVVFCPSAYSRSGSFNIVGSAGNDALSGVNTTASFFQRSESALTNDSCGLFDNYSNQGLANDSNLAQTSLLDGCYSYRYYARDRVGNTTISSACTVKVDQTLPSLSATNASNIWYATPRAAVIEATDALSGIAEIRYSYNNFVMNADCSSGGSVTTHGTSLTPPKGDTTLHLCARDQAGNVATWSGTYRYDDALPNITYVNTSNSSNYYNQTNFNNLTNLFTVQETIFGLNANGIRYLWTDSVTDPIGMTNTECSGGNLVSVTDGTTSPISHSASLGKPTTSGTYYLHLCAFNTIGSLVKDVSIYYLDTEAPTMPVQTVSPNATVMEPQKLTITFSSSDVHSGIDHYLSCYSNDGSVCTPNTVGNNLILSEIGQYRVCAQAVDKVGYISVVGCSDAQAYQVLESNNKTPSIKIENSHHNHIVTTSGGVTINGWVSDVDAGQTLTISATIGGVKRITTVNTPANQADWSLHWSFSQLPAGNYNDIVFTVTDGFESASYKYTGNILVDKSSPSLSFHNSSDEDNYYPLEDFKAISHPASTQDHETGLKTFRYQWSDSSDHPDGMTPSDCSQGQEVTFTSSTVDGVSSNVMMGKPGNGGKYYLHACVVDQAGNITKKHTIYYIEDEVKSSPTPVPSIRPSAKPAVRPSPSPLPSGKPLFPLDDKQTLMSDEATQSSFALTSAPVEPPIIPVIKNGVEMKKNSTGSLFAILSGGLLAQQPKFLPVPDKFLRALGLSENMIKFIVALSTQIFPFITLLMLTPIGLLMLIFPRPRGMVYDAQSKKGVAQALVAVMKEGRFITASLTNKNGLYEGFKLLPGEYQIMVSQPKFIFPSVQPRENGQTKDNYYLGEKFYIGSEFNQAITYRIPVDFDYTNNNQIVLPNRSLMSWKALLFLVEAINRLGLIWGISLGAVIFFTLIYPIWLNLIVFLIYMIGFSRRVFNFRKKYNLVGQLKNENNEIVPDVKLDLYLLAHDRLAVSTVTDEKGQFNFFAHPDLKYYLKMSHFDFVKNNQITSTLFVDHKNQASALDLTIRLKE